MQSLKWTFIIIFLMIFDMVDRDNLMLSVIAISIIIGFVTFSSMVNQIESKSGIFSSNLDSRLESKIESGKVFAPAILNEINHIEPNDINQNFYSPTKNFSIKKKTKVIHFYKNHIIFRIPLKENLESNVGVYGATMFANPKIFGKNKKNNKKKNESIKSSILSDIITEIKKEEPSIGEKIEGAFDNINVSIKSVRKYSSDEWKKIKSNTIPLPSEEVISRLGFKSKEEFDEKIQKGLINFIQVQGQIRARFRGLPAVSSEPNRNNIIWQGESHITIPQEIIDEMNEKGAKVIEIIPGKEEFLFYVKMR